MTRMLTLRKMGLFIATTCIVFAVETGTLAQMVQNVNINVVQKESNITAHNKTQAVQPYYEGEVVTVEQGGAYTYLEVKEHTEQTFWVAVNAAEVKVGDYVRFQKELVSKNFKSKALDRTFDELMFGSNLQHKIIK